MLLKGVLTNERHYEFLLSLREFNKNDSLLKQQVERYWGASTSEPVTLIDKLSLSISDRDYKVSSDAILELANVEFPCGVFIGERADTILVHLEGGEGQDAYNVRLSFANSKLCERLIEYYGSNGEWKHSSSKY